MSETTSEVKEEIVDAAIDKAEADCEVAEAEADAATATAAATTVAAAQGVVAVAEEAVSLTNSAAAREVATANERAATAVDGILTSLNTHIEGDASWKAQATETLMNLSSAIQSQNEILQQLANQQLTRPASPTAERSSSQSSENEEGQPAVETPPRKRRYRLI